MESGQLGKKITGKGVWRLGKRLPSEVLLFIGRVDYCKPHPPSARTTLKCSCVHCVWGSVGLLEGKERWSYNNGVGQLMKAQLRL